MSADAKPVLNHNDAALLTLTKSQRFAKRTFDIIVATILVIWLSPLILIGWIAARISTGIGGFFIQQRVGMHGKTFPLLKLRTMKVMENVSTTVTSTNDCRITRAGAVLRKLKIDELPQLLNIIVGHMSLVGPRPDVPGFADKLEGEDRALLTIRPGITGPATIQFRNEEELLANVDDPETYNREVIWPEKVRINLKYLRNYSMATDIKTLVATAIPSLGSKT